MSDLELLTHIYILWKCWNQQHVSEMNPLYEYLLRISDMLFVNCYTIGIYAITQAVC